LSDPVRVTIPTFEIAEMWSLPIQGLKDRDPDLACSHGYYKDGVWCTKTTLVRDTFEQLGILLELILAEESSV